MKLRYNYRQKFVIGGYTPSYLGLDALLVGFYRGKELRFARAVRGGFIPALRREVHDKIKYLEIATCPFINLPDRRPLIWTGHHKREDERMQVAEANHNRRD